MPKIETIISPALFHLHKSCLHTANIVVIDILRATTTICVALQNGAAEIMPVSEPEEAAELAKQGWLAAAERNGSKVDGFDMGNSPQEFTREKVGGRKIAITTTNGTRALCMSIGARNIFAGCFLNHKVLCDMLKNDGADVMLFCAGWKDRFNLEDTLFAGAVAAELNSCFDIKDDATLAAMDLFSMAGADMNTYLQKASHVNRFKSLHIESDLDACLKFNTAPVLPAFSNGIITNINHEKPHHA